MNKQSRIYRFTSAPLFYYGLFWSFMLLFLVLLNTRHEDFDKVILKSSVNVILFSALSYVIIEYLVPKFLSKQKLILFIFSIIGLSLLLTPIRMSFFYLIDGNRFFSFQELFGAYHIPFIEFLLVAIASTMFKLFLDVRFHQDRSHELEKQSLKSELKFLKSQIDPHFLFNTLNGIYALALKKSSQAPENILKLSDMLRYMLYECNGPTVPLEKEIQYIKNYIDLESMRLESYVDIKINIEGEVGQKEILPLIFSPIIENAFKHCDKSDHSYIHIFINIKEDHLFFNVKNKKDIDTSTSLGIGGIGLENVKRRLQLVYPGKHMLDVEEHADTFQIELYIKLKKVYHEV